MTSWKVSTISIYRFILSGDNVLHVLLLTHEYQSSLVTNCEDFMIAMCRPGSGLTVSTLLDYILAGDKYGLKRFLQAAAEFCAHVDLELLNGKNILRTGFYPNIVYEEMIVKYISSKFSKIEFKTQLAIAKRRLQKIEINTKRRANSDDILNDYTIQLT